MILNKEIAIKVSQKTLSHYIDLGYQIRCFSEINIPPYHLPKGSAVMIDCQCDKCNKVYKMKYYNYILNLEKNNNIIICRNCSTKRETTNLKKYGVKNISQLDEIKTKKENTFLNNYNIKNIFQDTDYIKNKLIKKYNITNPSKLEWVQDKIKKTNLERFGVEYSLQSKSVKEKSKNTNLSKYGVEYVTQLTTVREKMKETAIKNHGSLKEAYYDTAQKTIQEKYGVDNISKDENIKEKKIQTSIKNYGSKYPWQSEKGKLEQKEGIINKYGVDNISKLDEIKLKKITTNIERYGTDNYSKSIDFLSKMIGENNPNWKGGISGDGYCNMWKDYDFKSIILERDNHKCLNPVCGKKDIEDLTIHHIDYDKLNCHLNNLITLCRSCNGIANGDREWHESWYKAIILKRYGKRGL